MTAIILSIGDELALGQTVDTNSAWISQQLAAIGCEILGHATVPDNQEAIEAAMLQATGHCDFLIVSGGIGPTEDDLTRQALAAVMGVELEMNETWLAKLREFFKARGREMPEMNKIQAMIPRGATMIENTAGTAAGIDAVLGGTGPQQQDYAVPIEQLQGRPLGRVLTKMGKVTREQVVEALNSQKSNGGRVGEILIRLGYISQQDLHLALAAQRYGAADDAPQATDPPKVGDEHMERMFDEGERIRTRPIPPLRALARGELEPRSRSIRPTRVLVVPGVPKEMKAMFIRDVLPHIAKATGGAVILSRTLHTFGLGESWVGEKLGGLMDRKRNPSVGTTVSGGIVSLRVNARFGSREEAQKQLDESSVACRAALGDLIFGQDEQTLPQVVGELLKKDRERALTVATAESCTGGLLAKMITDVPGSSAHFTHGWVTYSNQAKYERLGVSMEVINVYGAVSEHVVEAMAKNARRLAKANFALAISGIAGPDGGSPTKPVGTVCIALVRIDPANKNNSIVVRNRTFSFPGDRDMIRDRSAMALAMLRFHLLGVEMPF